MRDRRTLRPEIFGCWINASSPPTRDLTETPDARGRISNRQ